MVTMYLLYNGSGHTKLGQWLILRVVVFEHILSIFIFISQLTVNIPPGNHTYNIFMSQNHLPGQNVMFK